MMMMIVACEIIWKVMSFITINHNQQIFWHAKADCKYMDVVQGIYFLKPVTKHFLLKNLIW